MIYEETLSLVLQEK